MIKKRKLGWMIFKYLWDFEKVAVFIIIITLRDAIEEHSRDQS